MIYKITTDWLGDYDGNGPALAAVKDGNVIGLRYYADFFPTVRDTAPAWVQAVYNHANGIDEKGRPFATTKMILNRVAHYARKCADCPTAANGKPYSPAELIELAQAVLNMERCNKFTQYKEECRKELAQLGEVVEGNVLGLEFIPCQT